MKRRCCKCGRKAVALANGKFWLCAECAEKATIESLALGQPIMEAVKGEPRYLLIPTGVNHGNN